MLKVKTLLVMGQTKYLNGQPVRDLGEKVKKEVDEAIKDINPEDIVDIKTNVQFTGVSGDQCFILVLYKEGEVKEVKAAVKKK